MHVALRRFPLAGDHALTAVISAVLSQSLHHICMAAFALLNADQCDLSWQKASVSGSLLFAQ